MNDMTIIRTIHSSVIIRRRKKDEKINDCRFIGCTVGRNFDDCYSFC